MTGDLGQIEVQVAVPARDSFSSGSGTRLSRRRGRSGETRDAIL